MDMAQLEWLSGLFDDASIPHEPAFPGAAPIIKSSALAAGALLPPDKMGDALLFRSSSPISVLEHGSFNNATRARHTGARAEQALPPVRVHARRGGGAHHPRADAHVLVRAVPLGPREHR